jgi:hypothetical protein
MDVNLSNINYDGSFDCITFKYKLISDKFNAITSPTYK